MLIQTEIIMTRTKPPKQKLKRKLPAGFVMNPGSKPPKWNDTMAFRIMFLATEGLTLKKIAIGVGVHEETLYYWRRTKPTVAEALEKGRQQYTEKVEQAVLDSAVGYSHPAIHFAVADGAVIQTPYIKHYPPNVAAIKFYLTNRAKNRWADIQQIDGVVQHKHTLDLTNLSTEQLDALETIGLVELPEHGSDTE